MVKNKHNNTTKYWYLILTIVFISIFVLTQDAFGQTTSLDNEDSNYKFELGEKSPTIDNSNHIENRNEKFAYGIMEKSDVFIIVVCVLIVVIEVLTVLKVKNKKHNKKII